MADPAELLVRGLDAYAAGRVEEAYRLCEEALSIDPGNVRAQGIRLLLQGTVMPALPPGQGARVLLPAPGTAALPPAPGSPAPQAEPAIRDRLRESVVAGRRARAGSTGRIGRAGQALVAWLAAARRRVGWVRAALRASASFAVLAALVLAAPVAWGFFERWLAAHPLGSQQGPASAAGAAVESPASREQAGSAPAPARRVRGARGAKPASAGSKVSQPPSSAAPKAQEASAPPPAPAPARHDAGLAWTKARWGMTVDEVIAALPEGSARVSPQVGRAAVAGRSVSVEGARLGSAAYSASFRFDADGTLDTIQLHAYGTAGRASARFDEAAEWVTRTYGAPMERREHASAEGSWDRELTWEAPDQQVDLKAWDRALRDAHVLSVDFRSVTIAPRDDGVVLTLQRGARP